MNEIAEVKLILNYKLICDICGAMVTWGDVRVEGDCPNCGVEWNDASSPLHESDMDEDVRVIRLYKK